MTSSPVTTARLNPLALAGFIVSLVGLLLLLLGWVGALAGLVGLVLSIVGRVQIGRRGERGNGLALAGIIIGAAVLVLGISITIYAVAVLVPQLQQLQQSR